MTKPRIAEHGQRILNFAEEQGRSHITVEDIAENVDVPAEDVEWLVENLERRGELRSMPVRYERVRDD